MSFAMFFLAEYANMILVSALASIMFLGGWLAPFVRVRHATLDWIVAAAGSGTGSGCSSRPSSSSPCSSGSARRFPRFRYDQIMRLGWKIFIPVTLVWLVVVGLVDPDALEHLELKPRHGCSASDQGFLLELHAHRAVQGHAADRPPLLRAQDHHPVPGGEDAAVSPRFRGLHALRRYRERRGALHRLQAVRGGLPGAGDHDRVATCATTARAARRATTST